jgi:hypothetical protein
MIPPAGGAPKLRETQSRPDDLNEVRYFQKDKRYGHGYLFVTPKVEDRDRLLRSE